jgi:transposase
MNISMNTLKEWWAKLKRGYDLWDRRSGNGKKKTFSDEALVFYIENNVNATLKEIGDYFSVSDVAILKRLRQMHYSYKKKRWCTKKEMKSTEKYSPS